MIPLTYHNHLPSSTTASPSLDINAPSFFPSPQPTLCLQERLRKQLQWWEMVVLPSQRFILEWIALGYRVPFLSRPPPSIFLSPPVSKPSHQQFLLSELTRLASLGAIEEVPLTSLSHSCTAHVVEKKHSDKLRLVINLRPINKFVQTPHVSFAGLKQAAALLGPRHFMATIDLSDAYLHLGIHPDHQDLLSFNINNRAFRVKALPFGLSASPYAFHTLMSAVVQFLRRRYQLNITFLLDDIFVSAPTFQEAERARDLVALWLHRLGILRNVKKGCWHPCQRLEYLGMMLDTTASPVFEVTPSALQDTMDFAQSVLAIARRNHMRVPERLLASFTGKALSLQLAVAQARLRTRAFYTLMGSATRKHLKWNRWLQLSPMCLTDLQWWTQLSQHSFTRPQRPPSMMRALRVATDASQGGWGSTLDQPAVSPLQTPLQTPSPFPSSDSWQQISGPWLPPQLRLWHITHKETAAVLLALVHWLPQLRNQRVLLLSDSSVTVAVVNNGCSRSQTLFLLTRQIWDLAAQNNITLVARHIPGLINPADKPSRSYDRHSWRLTDSAWSFLCQTVGRSPDVDLFADPSTALLPQFGSFHPHPSSLGDAFCLNWALFSLPYANPPWSQIQRVVDHATECQVRTLILVTPDWPSRHWYHILRRHSSLSFLLPLPSVLPTPLARKRRLSPEPFTHWGIRLRCWVTHFCPPSPS